jgi:hypothetical protein
MPPFAARRTTGTFLIVVPVVFTACFLLLQQLFEYPDILRQPTAAVLAKFAAGGAPLGAVWYVLALSAVAFIPLAVLVHRTLAAREAPPLLWVATGFGVVAGLVQALGFLRWPFLVPHLAQAYLDPAAGEAQRAAAGMVFEAFHRYAGMAVGEHLGYLSTSVWTLLVAIVLLRTARLPRWLGVVGAALALGIAAGLAEPAGWEMAGTINAVGYLLWAPWLMALGITLLLRRQPRTAPARPAAPPLAAVAP